MSERPLVSVIIPNYNHERFLSKRIESVANQSFDDIEILYLDDASTDGSEEVFRTYAGDTRIRAYRNRVNTGNPFVQWNKGVALAKGKYIWIAEADDYSETDFLERLIPILETHPEAGVAYTQSYVVDENDHILVSGEAYTATLDEDRWKNAFIAYGAEECARYLYIKNTIPNASAVVFRKDVYESAGGADVSYRLCGDWLLWAKLLMKSDIAYIPEHLNYYRTHGGNVRSAQTRYGKNFEETYRVRTFISNWKAPPADVVDSSNSTLAKKVVHQLFNGAISPRQLLKIIAAASHTDRYIFRHMLSATMKELKVRFTKVFSRRAIPDEGAAE